MKHVAMAVLLFFTATLSTWAVPARKGIWRNATLSDGTQVKVQLLGDEWNHYWMDANEQKYYENTTTGRLEIMNATMAKSQQARRLARMSVLTGKRAQRLARRASSGIKGEHKGLVILAQFTDQKFSEADPKGTYDKVTNEPGYSEGNFQGSVYDYFNAQSNGQLTLNFDVVGPVTVSHNMAYYGENDFYGYDLRPELMVYEACKAVADSVDFSDYDWDSDGEVEQVVVLFAGYGEADTENKSFTIWPHEWQLSSSSLDSVTALTIDGVKVDTYACTNELNASGELEGVGTFCHEFSHCLGFPDMYDTQYINYGMGRFDIMDQGSYDGDGYKPAGYTSYEKMTAGWITPVELSNDTTVSSLQPLSENGGAYIIYNQGNKNEYYLLENRQQTNWDEQIPGAGLLVLHVDYDEDVWYNNEVNVTKNATTGNDHQRCTIFHADNDDMQSSYDFSGKLNTTPEAGDPYPYNDNDSLTNSSSPAATVYNRNSDGTKYMNCRIYNITQNADGTVSFSFAPDSSTAVVPTDGVVFKETFDQCNGEGGNDNLFSGNMTTGDFTPDKDGWTYDYCYGADQCARFGNSKHKSVALTWPVFTLYNDSATLSFRAAGWNTKSEGTSLQLTASQGGDVQISDGDFTLTKGEWNTYTVTLTGTGNCQLTFISTGRFFLDDVVVTEPTTTDGIEEVTVVRKSQTADNKVYSISGVLLGTSLNDLPHGIYIVNGKKIVK